MCEDLINRFTKTLLEWLLGERSLILDRVILTLQTSRLLTKMVRSLCLCAPQMAISMDLTMPRIGVIWGHRPQGLLLADPRRLRTKIPLKLPSRAVIQSSTAARFPLILLRLHLFPWVYRLHRDRGSLLTLVATFAFSFGVVR